MQPTSELGFVCENSARPAPFIIDDGNTSEDAVALQKEDELLDAVDMQNSLYRYADKIDYLLMFVGSLGAAANGLLLTLFSAFLGDLINTFSAADGPIGDSKTLQARVDWIAIEFGILTVAGFIAADFEVCLWSISGYRQAQKARWAYLRSLLRQDMAFFDKEDAGSLASRVLQETQQMQRALGEKVGSIIHFTFTFLSSLALSFYLGWQLALLIMACVPILAASIVYLDVMQGRASRATLQAYAAAGTVAEQALGSIRTVKQLGAEGREAGRYADALLAAERAGIRGGIGAASGFGVISGTMLSFFGLAIWFGGWLIAHGVRGGSGPAGAWTAGDVVAVLFAQILGAMALGQIQPPASAWIQGRAAAAQIRDALARRPAIDALSPAGARPGARARGELEFRAVEFRYPARPEAPILRGLSLRVAAGETAALVGESGCGKSTAVQLLLRFYDPDAGAVLLDGRDVRDLNVAWLRRQIGLVSQEPVLFAASIADNISNGKCGGASQEEIEAAAVAANAHGFVRALPDGYATLCGERGAQLSGGQKQRIAIARALVRRPAVLLLDEATSALDTASERVVQDALDRARRGRTTLVIAHRLSTIRNADVIAVVRAGAVAEIGGHAELLARGPGGLYAEMVRRQESAGGPHPAAGDAAAAAAATGTDAKEARPPAPRSVGAFGDVSSLPVAAAASASLPPPVAEISAAGVTDGSAKTLEGGATPIAAAGDDEPNAIGGDSPLPEMAAASAAAAAAAAIPPPRQPALRRLVALSRPEAGWVAAGLLMASIYGAQYPAASVLFARAIAVLQGAGGSAAVEHDAGVFGGALAIVGAAAGLCVFGMHACFAVSGERLTRRLRVAAFRRLLDHRVGFFDVGESGSGGSAVLCARLATEAGEVRAASTERVGLLAQNLVTAALGLAAAFEASWKLALAVAACVPLLTLGALIENQLYRGGFESLGDDEAGELLGQALRGVRTAAAYTLEAPLLADFRARLARVAAAGSRRAFVSGAAFGFSQGVQYAVYGLSFWYGGRLLVAGEWARGTEAYAGDCAPLVTEGVFPDLAACAAAADLSFGFGKLMQCFWAVVLACWGVGEALSFAPDAGRALAAAARIFDIVDASGPRIEPGPDAAAAKDPAARPGPGDPQADLKVVAAGSGGSGGGGGGEWDIEFRGVVFHYPARPTVTVLKGFSLRVPEGKTAALVGESGCGKSTAVQLLLRYYDTDAGAVLLGGCDVRARDIAWLRRQIGLVSQEPVLFACSVRENVGYGRVWDEVTLDEIHDAARAANAHDFVSALPLGYDTLCGERGAQLSGGQKQRIAIARALVRRPTVLLLDEATSALDTASERVVQDALDRARRGRTTLVIAHRLSTIRNADIIASVQGGAVVETGTHEELVARPESIYASLIRAAAAEVPDQGAATAVGMDSDASKNAIAST